MQLGGNVPQAIDMAFSDDGGRLVASGSDHSLTLWDLRSGQHITKRGDSASFGVRVAAGAGNLASVDRNGIVTTMDPVTGRETATLTGQASSSALALSADGSALATVGIDGIVTLWNLDVEQAVHRACSTIGTVSQVEWDSVVRDLAYDPNCTR